jgi:hypothetical protein
MVHDPVESKGDALRLMQSIAYFSRRGRRTAEFPAIVMRPPGAMRALCRKTRNSKHEIRNKSKSSNEQRVLDLQARRQARMNGARKNGEPKFPVAVVALFS